MAIQNRECITDQALRFDNGIKFWRLISDHELVNAYNAASKELANNDFRAKWIAQRTDLYFNDPAMRDQITKQDAIAAATEAYDREVGMDRDTRNYNPDNT